MWQEEIVWCFLGLNVAPSRPHCSWFNIKAIKSQLLFSQYIVSELKLSSRPVNSIFFQSFFTVAWLWFFFKYILVISVFIIKAVKQKQKIKESHRWCWGINCCRVGFHFITPPRDPKHFPPLLWHRVPNSQTSSCLIKTSAALFFIHWWKWPSRKHPNVSSMIHRGPTSLVMLCNIVQLRLSGGKTHQDYFDCIVIFVGSTFQKDQKPIVINVATAPPSSEEGKRSNPSKASHSTISE